MPIFAFVFYSSGEEKSFGPAGLLWTTAPIIPVGSALLPRDDKIWAPYHKDHRLFTPDLQGGSSYTWGKIFLRTMAITHGHCRILRNLIKNINFSKLGSLTEGRGKMNYQILCGSDFI